MNTTIRLVQMDVIPGMVLNNFQYCKKAVTNALRDSIDVIVFPELCLSGYLIGDMWEEQSFLNECDYYGKKLAQLSTNKLTIIFGNVFVDNSLHNSDGRYAKLNGAFVAQNGAFVSVADRGIVYPKVLLPNYREFEEPRHFKDGRWYSEKKHFNGLYAPVKINDSLKIGLTICEDGWCNDYDTDPIQHCVKNGADLILNLSCSPFTLNKNLSRDRVFSEHARQNNTPLCYVNTIGLQNNGKTIFTFDGSTIAYDCDGKIVSSLNMFTDDCLDVVYSNGHLIKKTLSHSVQLTETEQLYSAIIYGIKKYLKMSNLKKVVIGSSGGIDSAVVAALYCDAIGSENVYLVNMPSKFNSDTTKSLSHKLASNLNAYYATISIQEAVELTNEQVNNTIFYRSNKKPLPIKLSAFNIENVQARDRSSRILSAVSSALNAVFTNNGNKTEATVGYCTLYGDNAGFLAAIGDLWKTQVYALGKFINEKHMSEIIPHQIFNIVPCAELSSEQDIDANKGDPLVYWYHDYLFRSWQEWWNRSSPEETIEHYIHGDLCKYLGIENKTDDDIKKLFASDDLFINDIERWWTLFKGMGIAKRVQTSPVLAVSKRAYGFDYRETLNGVYFTHKYTELKNKLLGIVSYE